MNAASKNEVAMLAQLSSLPPAQRAAIALSGDKSRIELVALAQKSASILTVTNIDGRKEAHAAGMVLKNTRTTIRATGKAAREDATAFSKAIIAEEDSLIALIEPEETRIFKLRDDFDAIEKARKEAEAAAERARIAKIAEHIAAIRQHGTDVITVCKTAASTQETIDSLAAIPITEEVFHERAEEAATLKAATLDQMHGVLTTRIAAEAAEVQRLADIEAENKRIAAERAELAQLREEAAERARLAKVEADRVAEEAAQTERARVAADTKRQLEEQAAQIAADRAAEPVAQVAAPTPATPAIIRLRRAPTAIAPVPSRPAPAADLLDAADELYPADSDILDVMFDQFGLSAAEAIERLAKFDFVAARAGLVAEAA